MSFTQDNRLISIDTPLGKDVLLLSSIQGNDGVSTPFSFELGLLSENTGIKFQDIIGKNVTVAIVLADGEKRYFNGLILRFAQGPSQDNSGMRFATYTATMVPWLWLLTKTADSRIFQNLSVPDIVKKIFQDLGLLDFKFDLSGSYSKRDYCVQYRETDFNFVSRLLEDEGIFYFFEHGKKKHTLVIGDAADKHKPCPKQESAWCELTTGGTSEKDMIERVEVTQEITSGKYTLNDFNFETPATDLKVNAPSPKSLGPGEREVYDYPGGFVKRAGGDRLVNIRMEEKEAAITTISGTSKCRAFTSGYKFTLKDYYRDDMNNKDYVLTSISHSASQEYSSGGGGSGLIYSNSFTCIPHDVPYRPRRVTRAPVVEGVQTAIVVGPKGEELFTDEHGRVKVQFHWDREGEKDDKSSCWIRVSQLWAGAGWGAMHIPRTGQEVIVDFLEGDPDRPIITGRVYHGTNKPPYDLPGAKTQSVIMSNTSKGGSGSNELRFEDKKGEEEVYVHAQKNTTIKTENDKNQSTGNDETLLIANDRTKKVDNDEKSTIGNDRTEKVENNESITIVANRTQDVGKEEKVTIGDNCTVKVGKSFKLTADKEILLKTGAASIHMKKDGKIVIKGKNILIKGSGNIKLKGQKIAEN